MTINTDLLVAAPMLQDYLVDKVTGFPLANGLISMYKDTARTFYKNWYYQTGVPGAYTWIPLDNPLHLSSVGTIQDPNGNDVIPFYYPFSEDNENEPEPYYVTVYSTDENGDPATLQFTRENFPFQPSNVNPTATNPTWRNYILNNVYWRNLGTQDLTNVTNGVIAPSQHEGYSDGYSDIRFLKNITGASDAIAFNPMTQTLDNDVTPEYYLNFKCTALQLGETQKCIQYPVSLHVKTLQNQQATIVFQGQNVAGNTNNYVDLYVYQFLGTGAITQPAPILIQRVLLNNSFQKFVIPFIFPDASTAVLGNGGDDALFIQVQYPLAVTFEINHTKPQLYLSTDVPDNDFDTYDQIETIINSPRKGDVRTSINSFYPMGWVPLNGGSIGNSSSNASTRANIDTFPLFSLMWSKFSQYTSGSTNPIAQMVTSAGSNVAYGASAIADWNANNAIYLTQSMGRVILGTVPVSALLGGWNTTFTASSSSGLLVTTSQNVNAYNGATITFTNSGGALPTGLTAGVIYYVAGFNGSNTFHVSTSFANAMAGTYVSYTDAGSGTNTVMIDITGTLTGEYAHSQLLAELASHHHAMNATANNGASAGSTVLTNDAATLNTSDVGSNTPMNVTQPATLYNIYMKL